LTPTRVRADFRASGANQGTSGSMMISCVVEYTIDPHRVNSFEEYARRWMAAVTRLGGTHHGYFLPDKDPADRAICIFSFPSMADYEAYRQRVAHDPECIAILEQEKAERSIVRYSGSFFRPLLPEAGPIV
jgi:hypothetical protein